MQLLYKSLDIKTILKRELPVIVKYNLVYVEIFTLNLQIQFNGAVTF